MNIKEIYKLYQKYYLIDTDSRKIRKNSIFFALKGDNFNGNIYATQALKKGARFAIVDEKEYAVNDKILLVKDVLETLQNLATYHRNKLNIPIIALTGSNGKTTTKELINIVISQKFKTTATLGNLNNHIGVPLTLLSMTSETEIGIVEMGANHLKEVEFLSNIAEPNYGYITNFGKAHLEGFGSIKGVQKGKSELYTFLRENNQKAFINLKDKLQIELSKGINTIPFGKNNEIELIECNPFVIVKFKNQLIKSNLIGAYNYNNIAAAIAIGDYFKIDVKNIKNAIENYIPSNNRSQIIEKKSNKIILDAYNANPSSMEVALENFNSLKEEHKVVFLGDMFELGKSTETEHQKIADLASSYNFDKVYLIGKAFSTTLVKNAFVYDSFDNFKNSNSDLNLTNSTILIKGSRGMALERILDLL